MVRLMLLGVLACTAPAWAQRSGCGYGEGLARLEAAERLLAAPTAGLAEGREQASGAAETLRAATPWLAGCGCRRLAEQAAEAAGIAEQARSEAGVPELRRSLDRARFSLRLAREAAGREGCR